MFHRAIVCLFFGACTTSAPSTGIDVSTLECPPGSTLDYETYGRQVIADTCLECHAGKESPRLDSVEAVRANSASILREAVGSTAMPESGDMTDEERQLLGEWLACGAP